MPPLPISEELHLSLEGNRIRGIFNLSGQKGVRKEDKKYLKVWEALSKGGKKTKVIYIYIPSVIPTYTA